MRNFISFLKKFHIYNKKELLDAFASFSKRETVIFYTFFAIAIISTLLLLSKVNDKLTISVPANGGTITEGIIGMPTLINPVLAISDADKDLTSIVYSGLMRKMPDGTFANDLAESYTVSADGMIYTFIIKKDADFHNHDKITVDDIIFTVEKIKNPAIKSPRKTNWEGVSVKKINDYTVSFILDHPYISFMDNTTIGILPSLAWKKVSDSEFGISPLNIKAVGGGPYKIKSVSKNKNGIPIKYKLERFSNFTLSKPYIKYFNIVSYANEKDLVRALSSGSIDQASGISPSSMKNINASKFKINTATLPRIFGLFVNSNKNKIFLDPNVVNALNLALSRQDIIDQILGGYGTVIHSPIPETIIKDGLNINQKNASVDEAVKLLEKSGWVLGEDGTRFKGGTTIVEKTSTVKGKKVTQKVKVDNGPQVKLAFSITTGDTPELRKATSIIKEQLSKVGVEVNIDKVYETGQLNQLIMERDYEALFFGQIVNHESDLYSFWHSSQRTHPGLNIAMYSNSKIDSILETIQKTLNLNDRINKYQELSKEFNNNIPALLIYSPKYLYITSKNLEGVSLDTITIPSDRFTMINNWYIEKDKVWKIFSKFTQNNF